MEIHKEYVQFIHLEEVEITITIEYVSIEYCASSL